MGLVRFVRIRGRVVWFALIALMALSVVPSAAPAADASSQPAATSSFSLQFNSLPSAQGWTYFQGDGIPETSAFSVTGTSLMQHTVGTGIGPGFTPSPNYAMFGVVDGTQPFQLTVRARILSYEGTGPFGFFFAVRTASPNQDYAIGFSPSGVVDGNGNGVAIDTTTFHTYVLRATPGGPYTLDIDGHFALGGTFDTKGGALNAVQFGDGNSQFANANAEVTQLDFTQGSGAQLTFSIGNNVAFPVGEHGHYTLTVENPPTSTASTTGPITVTDTLPAGLIFDSGSGPNWTCSAAGTPQVITCTNPGPLAPGDVTAIDVVVSVDASSFCQGSAGCWNIVTSPPPVTDTATVSTAGFPDVPATDDTTVCRPSGADWADNSPWPEKPMATLSLNDLDPAGFQQDVKMFTNALANATNLNGDPRPVLPILVSTYRLPQRAYLMHFAGAIGYGLSGMPPMDPSLVPSFPVGDSNIAKEEAYPLYRTLYQGPDRVVNICWVHTNGQGDEDLAASQKAAQDMLTPYHTGHGAAFPTLHSLGEAVDMRFTWGGIIIVTTPDGVFLLDSKDKPPANPGGSACLDDNPGLDDVGAFFGVIKLPSDCLHWSINGK